MFLISEQVIVSKFGCTFPLNSYGRRHHGRGQDFAAGARLQRAFQVSLSLMQHCGENAGQHLYIDAGRGLASEAALTAVFTGTASRTWKIKVTQVLHCPHYPVLMGVQVLCSAGVPAGCYQYLTGLTGGTALWLHCKLSCQAQSDLSTFSPRGPTSTWPISTTRSASGGRKAIASKNTCSEFSIKYSLKQRIAWTQSSDPDSFKLSRPSTNFQSQVGSAATGACSADSVKIPGGSNLGLGGCITPVAQATPVPSVDRYCGGTLTCQRASTFQSTIVT